MRAQSTQAACGMASVANACQALGIPHTQVSESVVAEWFRRAARGEHPDVEGAGDSLMVRAINDRSPRPWGLRAWPVALADPRTAVAALRGHLLAGAVGVLCVDAHEHWVTATSINGDRFVVADPGDNEIILVYDEHQLAGRWCLAGEPPVHFAVMVAREPRRRR